MANLKNAFKKTILKVKYRLKINNNLLNLDNLLI